jgi:hypothetical protein
MSSISGTLKTFFSTQAHKSTKTSPGAIIRTLKLGNFGSETEGEAACADNLAFLALQSWMSSSITMCTTSVTDDGSGGTDIWGFADPALLQSLPVLRHSNTTLLYSSMAMPLINLAWDSLENENSYADYYSRGLHCRETMQERLTHKFHLLLRKQADTQLTKLNTDTMLPKEARAPSLMSAAIINLVWNSRAHESLESIEKDNTYSTLVAEFHVRDIHAVESMPERIKRKFQLLHREKASAQLGLHELSAMRATTRSKTPSPHKKRTEFIAKVTAIKSAAGWGLTHPTHCYSW